jgi:hypothetical protein
MRSIELHAFTAMRHVLIKFIKKLSVLLKMSMRPTLPPFYLPRRPKRAEPMQPSKRQEIRLELKSRKLPIWRLRGEMNYWRRRQPEIENVLSAACSQQAKLGFLR